LIAFNSQHFSALELTTISMTRATAQFLKLSNDGDIISKALDFQYVVPITGIAIF